MPAPLRHAPRRTPRTAGVSPAAPPMNTGWVSAFRSYPDRLHGGVIATLLDSAMVHALFARGIAGVTAELTIRYLRHVSWTGPLRVTGHVVSERHGLFICRAEVHQAGLQAVRASAKFMAMENDH